MIFRFHRVLLPDQIRFQTSCCQGVRSLLGECVANLLLFLFQTPLVAPDGSLFDSLPALGRIFTCCCRVCVGVHRSHEVAVPRPPGRDDLLGVALYISRHGCCCAPRNPDGSVGALLQPVCGRGLVKLHAHVFSSCNDPNRFT